jgi:sugar phosphate isomerase/epimerase
MKIGMTYLFTIFKYGYPPKVEDDFKALADIERLGFHYLEMEGLGPEHTAEVWARRHEFKRALGDHGIHVHNFCGVDPDLVNLETTKRHQAYDRFRRTAELGAFFEAETLHLASYCPPVEYLGQSPYQLGQDYSFSNTFRVRIPDAFSWQQVWSVLVESCRLTAEIAKECGRTVIMEPRVGETICSVDSLIRLIDQVGMDNFKANFDTGHFSAQRENAALALLKLEGKYGNIHLSDNDPINTDHLPLGEGTIDWHEFFRILKVQDYEGYLGLDLGWRSGIEHDLRKSLEVVQTIGAIHGLHIEV